MMYPNGKYMTNTNARHTGSSLGLDSSLNMRNDRFNRYIGSTWNQKTGDLPSGYGIGGGAIIPARVAGGFSALTNPAIDLEKGNSDLLSGMILSYNGTFLILTPNGNLSLNVSLNTTANILTFTGTATIAGVTQMIGASTITFTPDGSLSLNIPIEGAGSWAITGTADMKGRLSMIGEWTPYTELSPENLAIAVWGISQGNIDNVGTAGKALLAAGSAGDPWSTEIPGTYTGDQAGAILQKVKNNTGLIPATL